MPRVVIRFPNWLGPNNNNSYSIALRHFLESLKLTDFNFTFSKSINEINIHFHPPAFFLKEKSIYDIIYFFWETSIISQSWANNLKRFDEVWVPCNLSKNAVKNSGYNGIINVIPPSCEILLFKSSKKHLKSKFPFLSKNKYKFYSIFEWSYRKGWDCLISSYFDSFTKEDDVVLYLKVKPIEKVYSSSKVNILMEIDKLKSKHKKQLPRIILNFEHLKYKDLMNIHKVCDCYVSPHRGEGWGYSLHEASLFNNSIISTKCGGFSESLNDFNSYIVKSNVVNVKNMDWAMGWYSKDQLWAEPCKKSLSEQMIKAYNERKSNSVRCGKQFSYSNVSKLINRRLYEIKNS